MNDEIELPDVPDEELAPPDLNNAAVEGEDA